MTPAQAKRLQGLINVRLEAERGWLRAKNNFTSYARIDGWKHKVNVADAALRSYITEMVGP